MKCQRVVQILEQLRKAQPVSITDEEFEQMRVTNLVQILPETENIGIIQQDLDEILKNYDSMTQEIRNLHRDLVNLENRLQQQSFLVKFAGKLKLGSAAVLKNQIKEQRQIILQKTTVQAALKNQILDLNTRKEKILRTVEIKGNQVILSTVGDTIIEEIAARPRFKDRPLENLLQTLVKLDQTYTDLLQKISTLMPSAEISALWLPYLLSLGFENTIPYLSNVAMNSYGNPDLDIMKITLQMLFFQGQPPRGTGNITAVNRFRDIVNRLRNNLSVRSMPVAIEMIAYLVQYWSPELLQLNADLRNYCDTNQITNNPATWNFTEQYMTKLEQNFAQLNTQPDFQSLSAEDKLNSLLILGFVDNIQDFSYFLNHLKNLQDGKGFFAAVAAIFPWPSQETWMVLRRAESNILRAQSAQFLPELMEYAILLTMNPTALAIENGITAQSILRWRFLVIPTIQSIMVTGMEQIIENYIMSRPYAYITSPRYYYYGYHRGYGARPIHSGMQRHHSSLHHHTIG
jgi:hypothetical protein